MGDNGSGRNQHNTIKRTVEGGRTRIDATEKARIRRLLDKGHSQAEVARLTGRHYNTIQKFGKEQRAAYVPDDTDEEALKDFGLFRRRFMGRVATPWQIMAANKIVELLDSPHDEYLVLNCPPGSGKSTLLTDICTWVLCRNRATRIMYGSAAQAPASDYTNRVMNDLTRPEPTRATTREVLHGLAVDGESTLQKAYGAFKPANGAKWTKEKFYVQQIDGTTVQEKEPNMVAFGRDSTFLGGRFDLVVWDDLVSEKTLRTTEAREALIGWWNNTAETRVEPGGLNVLVGQRLSADDLYRYCIDLPSGADMEEDGDGALPMDGNYARKYTHLVFPAHDEDKCQGTVDNPDHKLDGRYWPEGCLLDPKRLSWRKLAMLRANPLNSFETVYQQQDSDPSTALVQQDWINGGKGKDGIQYVGCLDRDRGLNEVPPHLAQAWSVITVDPSPSRYWTIQWWLCHEETQQMFLMNHIRKAMSAPEWLDYNIDSQSFSGVAEDLVRIAEDKGRPVTHMIVEENAAQRFMLQNDFIKRWQQSRNVLIVPHATNRNKADDTYGVQSMAPAWMHGRVRLPYKNSEAQLATLKLTTEVTKWPKGATDDAVMAMWFVHFQWPKIAPGAPTEIRFARPSWLRVVS